MSRKKSRSKKSVSKPKVVSSTDLFKGPARSATEQKILSQANPAHRALTPTEQKLKEQGLLPPY